MTAHATKDTTAVFFIGQISSEADVFSLIVSVDVFSLYEGEV